MATSRAQPIHADSGTRRSVTLALHAIFFVSGALALVYEVLWMRRFAVLFGAAAPSAAATVSAMFIGLAAGSVVLGARSERWRRPLRAFGLLEIGTGLSALLVLPILLLHEKLLPLVAGATSSHAALVVAVKLLLAIVAVFLPTFLMGGTLPALARAALHGAGVDGGAHLGVGAGGLYAVNTAGAALGALAVPTVLLPLLGARGASLAAVAGSCAVGACALLLDRGRDAGTPPAVRATREPAAESSGWGRLLGLAFLSGALTLALETLWSRTLALVHESSVHSFAVVLAVFLAGLAGGAALARWILARGTRPDRVLAFAWVGAGVAVALSPRLFVALTDGLRYVEPDAPWMRREAHLAGIALATMLPATLLAGMVLPSLMELAGSKNAPAGTTLGRLLGANLLGAIAGPLVVAFLVTPRVGLWWSITAVAAALVLCGEASPAPALARVRARRWTVVLASWAAVGGAFLVSRPDALPRVRLDAGESLVSLRDGTLGTVAVVERDGERRMMLDNVYTMGGTLSTGDERMQAHLPLLLHPSPRRVAFLGLGTGITAGAALLHPVEDVTAVELIPEVVAAAREDFAEANLHLVEDRRTTIAEDDARTWLRLHRGAFDVIVGDLFVPWRRGEASLYTLEEFQAMRRALAPGGVACQWVPAFQLTELDLRQVVRTFVEVFPHAVLWRGDFNPDEPALGLVGFEDNRVLDSADVDRRVRELAAHPDPDSPYLADPAGPWLFLIGPVSAGDAWLADTPLNRDDEPWVELRSPTTQSATGRGFVGPALTALLDKLRAAPLDATPLRDLDGSRLAWRDAGASLWRASLLAQAGRLEEADALGFLTLASLPPPILAAVRGEPAPAPVWPAVPAP